jgi:hypothetical protein
MASTLRLPAWLLALAAVLLVACNQGLPTTAGEYPIRPQSVTFDGNEYSFYWTAPDGQLHQARGDDFKLVQDDRTYLEVGTGTPVLHLTSEEPVAVRGQDHQGGFSSWWFPFMLGTWLGGGPPILSNPQPVPQTGAPPGTPAYRYPPTDTFGRGDTLHGSEVTSRPSPPDYRKVQPAPYAVSGQGGGVGAGAAASNKDAVGQAGQAGGAGAGSAASNKGTTGQAGQSGGVGSGSAATAKGGATADSAATAAAPSRSGPSAPSPRSGAGAGRVGGRR